MPGPWHVLVIEDDALDRELVTELLPYISVQSRQVARHRGAFDVVVRGDLNGMWVAIDKQLTLRTAGGEIETLALASGR